MMKRLQTIPAVFLALVLVEQSHARAPVERGAASTCALIPLEGAVGLSPDLEHSFSAADFRDCLEAASNSRVDTIVVYLNSPGGRVDSKESIMRELLVMRAKGLRTVAIIQDAGSAAALIALACSEWYVLPGARLGAAATVLVSPQGTVSFDRAFRDDPTLAAKYKSFASAADNEACRATGRSLDLALAMKERDATLFFTQGQGFSKERRDESSIELDSKETILTLTATQLQQFGLAKPAASLEQAMKEIGQFDPKLTQKLKSAIRKSCGKLERLLKTRARLIAERNSIPDRSANKQTESARESARKSKSELIDRNGRDILELLQTP
jgi:membrane-bound ClpP family serine protease